eukprot:3522992-Amphidinium_carterae.1
MSDHTLMRTSIEERRLKLNHSYGPNLRGLFKNLSKKSLVQGGHAETYSRNPKYTLQHVQQYPGSPSVPSVCIWAVAGLLESCTTVTTPLQPLTMTRG